MAQMLPDSADKILTGATTVSPLGAAGWHDNVVLATLPEQIDSNYAWVDWPHTMCYPFLGTAYVSDCAYIWLTNNDIRGNVFLGQNLSFEFIWSVFVNKNLPAPVQRGRAPINATTGVGSTTVNLASPVPDYQKCAVRIFNRGYPLRARPTDVANAYVQHLRGKMTGPSTMVIHWSASGNLATEASWEVVPGLK